jgi:hypothetical protein
MYTDSEVESILIAAGYSCRHRKRIIKNLELRYQSKIRRTANHSWESNGVPTENWKVLKHCKDLVGKYGR